MNLLTTSRIKGESLVWLTGLGLALALLMAVVLLLVIVANGADVFWPKRVVELTVLKDGTPTTVLGEITETRTVHNQDSGDNHDEFKVYTGNRDAFRSTFRFVPVADITTRNQPEGILVVERAEYGNAVGLPAALKIKGADGKIEQIPAADARFEPELNRLVGEARVRVDEIRRIEKVAMADASAALKDLETRRTQVREPLVQSDLDRQITDQRAALTELKKQAATLRAKQKADKLALTVVGSPTGVASQIREIDLGKIVGLTWPNREGFFGRLGICFHRLWTFVSDDPREANTEGGIFPAIFGTFTMTLLMTVAVVPFGVIAAIYLREYAKQGPMVRLVRIAVNNLAGVPSIVFGVFGLGFFVYVLGGSVDQLFFTGNLPNPTFGTGGVLWAALTLSLMTVPVVIVATEEAIAAVPRGVREASLACGASKWQTISRIVLPGSVPGILTGAILAMARGAGEVAPLMLVGVVKLAPTLPINGEYPFVHLEQKFMHLGFHIFDLAFQSPDSEAARPAVFATTFFLILLVLVMNLAAILLRDRIRKRMKTAAF